MRRGVNGDQVGTISFRILDLKKPFREERSHQVSHDADIINSKNQKTCEGYLTSICHVLIP